MFLSQCLTGAFDKSCEILSPRPKDQKEYSDNTELLGLCFGKPLSCFRDRSIILLVLVSWGSGDTAIPRDMQGLLGEHRYGRKALDPEGRLQNSCLSGRSLLKKLCVKKDPACLGGWDEASASLACIFLAASIHLRQPLEASLRPETFSSPPVQN